MKVRIGDEVWYRPESTRRRSAVVTATANRWFVPRGLIELNFQYIVDRKDCTLKRMAVADLKIIRLLHKSL